MFQLLTEQSLERIMCITLCGAREEPVGDRAATLALTGYRDWFSQIPQILETYQKIHETELIFDANSCPRSRLYILPGWNTFTRELSGATFSLNLMHMNHGVNETNVKRIFRNIYQNLKSEQFPVLPLID